MRRAPHRNATEEMILPLRQRHRRMTIALGIILPVAFVAGIALRKPMPLRTETNWRTELLEAEILTWERSDLFPKVPVRVRWFQGPAWYRVGFSADRRFAKPDLLVYWVGGNPTIGETLSANARLLGPFNPSLPLQLPRDAATAGGVLVLYSLADNEIVDASKPMRFNDSAQ
jgi:hypothetical protein